MPYVVHLYRKYKANWDSVKENTRFSKYRLLYVSENGLYLIWKYVEKNKLSIPKQDAFIIFLGILISCLNVFLSDATHY